MSASHPIKAFRCPPQLEQRLESLAQRDSNSVSATIRRLLTAALRAEQRDANDRG